MVSSMEIKIGSAGWSYKDWVGPFYPKKKNPNEYLSYYSEFFDVVEINSTFYNIPQRSTISGWLDEVPDDFLFSVKVWCDITHNRNLGEVEERISAFLSNLELLEQNISHYLLQFPPSFKFSEKNVKYLRLIIKNFVTDKQIVVEFRDNSWFDSKFLNDFFINDHLILGVVYLDDITPYYLDNQKSNYIRVIGDRKLTEFNRVQRSNDIIWDHLKKKVDSMRDEVDITYIFIIFNNHYSGFSPHDSIRLKKELNLKYKDYSKQKSLLDFM